ncbi:MAG TPA: NADH-quinone oxidoreductase subunit C, partial [Thermoanaerobaculia bacterium]
MTGDMLRRRNAQIAALDDVPLLDGPWFRRTIVDAVRDGARIASLFARETDSLIELVAVLAGDASGELGLARTRLDAASFQSITPDCPQAQLFEREIAEQYGVQPAGHPWLKPVRLHDVATDFFRVEGEEVHEVAVGPVHAGVIEPGHFRFQCHGERVFHLEIALGYQHRGVERALIGGPHSRTVFMMETAAGDSTIAHTLAYSLAVEALAGAKPPARAQVLRGIALELERLANHTGDLGALSGDVAYLPAAAYCGRLRGDYLNLTAELCGSRFGRGLVRPGGVVFDLAADRVDAFIDKLATATREAVDAIGLLWTTPSVIERFENTGTVDPA